MKRLSLATLVLFLAACGGSKSAATSSTTTTNTTSGLTQADADRGAAKFPGTTLASLIEGKTSYETHCQTCHGLKTPASQTEDGWKKIVPNMVGKVNRKAGKEAISAEMQESILRYVVTMSSAPAK